MPPGIEHMLGHSRPAPTPKANYALRGRLRCPALERDRLPRSLSSCRLLVRGEREHMPLAACFRVTGPKIVHEVFDDEVVIINLDTGTYYSVEGVAADIWTRIDGTTSKEIIDDLTDRYEASEEEVAPLIMRFLNELQSEGLIVAAETLREKAAEGSKTIPGTRAGHGQFQAPILRKFDDMQELLLLDPIHDFDDAGWPIAKPAEPLEK